MKRDSLELSDVEKLVNTGGSLYVNGVCIFPPKNDSTNKPIRRITDPHLRPHKVKGRLYYSYCRGTDVEIYLGSADAILKAVKGK